jgi:hypothetical protein
MPENVYAMFVMPPPPAVDRRAADPPVQVSEMPCRARGPSASVPSRARGPPARVRCLLGPEGLQQGRDAFSGPRASSSRWRRSGRARKQRGTERWEGERSCFEFFVFWGVTELRSYFSLFSPAMTLRMSESPAHDVERAGVSCRHCVAQHGVDTGLSSGEAALPA